MKNKLFFEEMIFEEAKILDNLSSYGGKVTKYVGFTKTELTLDSDKAKELNRRKGIYYSFNVNGKFSKNSLITEIANSLKILINSCKVSTKNILLVGLGNRFVTADSLGENTLSKIDFKLSVKKFCPSVKSVTNIESTSLVKAIVKSEKPTLIIIIDSLATREFSKLCSSVQLTSSGIVAGGGAYLSDKLFDETTMGVPVIAIGVPLIINLSKLATSHKGLLCPHQIDLFVNEIGDILSASITKAISKN